jgi:hypothetical protein
VATYIHLVYNLKSCVALLPRPLLRHNGDVFWHNDSFTPGISTESNFCLVDQFLCRQKNVIILELMKPQCLNNCSRCLFNWSASLLSMLFVDESFVIHTLL